MSAGKMLLASFVAAIVMFIWGGLAHMVLGLGETGIKELPNEEAVITALQANLTEPGFYFFPGLGMTPEMGKEEQKAAMEKWAARYQAGPNGILVYHPVGEQAMSIRQFLVQILTYWMGALIAAFLLSKAMAGRQMGFWQKVFFVGLIGLAAGVTAKVPEWNWYRFPSSFIIAAIVDGFVAFLVGGLILGWMSRAKKQMTA
jgi:hypothetical protein